MSRATVRLRFDLPQQPQVRTSSLIPRILIVVAIVSSFRSCFPSSHTYIIGLRAY
jgi:hypothetical protein